MVKDFKKTISIITPSYNVKKYFLETFNSVINQTYKDFEWIIIDDNSSDNSLTFIKNLTNKYLNIIVLSNSKNLGAAETRNLGITKASGKYIAFIDSDDIWDPKKLEKQVRFMEENNILFSYTNYNILKNNIIKPYRPRKNKADYKTF